MRILVPAAALAALTACTMSPAETARAQDRAAAGRAELAQKLNGLHPAGKSDCLNSFDSRSASLTAYGPALVYRVNAGLAYVSDTGGGCEAVSRGDILVTVSNEGQLCRGDIARTVMPGSRTTTGSCALGSFTKYVK